MALPCIKANLTIISLNGILYIMKLIPKDTDLSNMDCHVHSFFSRDSGSTPEQIVAQTRKKGLRGFIVTDHIDEGHWPQNIDFDEYFRVWNKTRDENPDLTIYIGLEVGYEARFVEQTRRLIEPLPLEYVINSVHYMFHTDPDNLIDHYALGRIKTYTEYIETVINSLDVPYEFNTIGHFGFAERLAPDPRADWIMDYKTFKPLMDEVIRKAVARGVRFEENTNGGGEMRIPRGDFLRAYKAAGGVRPVISSDAHEAAAIGRYFDRATAFLDEIFG